MTSPYIAREAKRLHIVARNPTARPKTIISSHADYRPSDYRFARTQTDPTPLEKSPPIASDGARLLRGFTIALIFAAMWAACSGAVWFLTRGG
jgi:hypothetical protein